MMGKRKQLQFGIIATRPFNSRLYGPDGITIMGVVQQSQGRRYTELEGTNTVRLNPDYQLTEFHTHLLRLEYIAQHPDAMPEVETTKRPVKPLTSPTTRAAWIAAQPEVKAHKMTVGAVLTMLTKCNRIEAARLRAGIEPAVPYDKPGFGREKKKAYSRKLGTSSRRG